MEQEESLQQLVKWGKHRHIVQRDLALFRAPELVNPTTPTTPLPQLPLQQTTDNNKQTANTLLL
jgi:hypothetical protein